MCTPLHLEKIYIFKKNKLRCLMLRPKELYNIVYLNTNVFIILIKKNNDTETYYLYKSI